MIEKMTLGQLKTLSRNLACRLEIQHGRDLVTVLGNGMERNNREALQTWITVKSVMLMEATEQMLTEMILEDLASAQKMRKFALTDLNGTARSPDSCEPHG